MLLFLLDEDGSAGAGGGSGLVTAGGGMDVTGMGRSCCMIMIWIRGRRHWWWCWSIHKHIIVCNIIRSILYGSRNEDLFCSQIIIIEYANMQCFHGLSGFECLLIIDAQRFCRRVDLTEGTYWLLIVVWCCCIGSYNVVRQQRWSSVGMLVKASVRF